MSFQNADEEIAWEFGRGGKEQAALLQEETLSLIRAAREKSQRDGLILRTLYATATRVSELVALCFTDLTYEECRAFVREGKGGKDRYTLMDEETAALLQAWQGQRPPQEPIFGIAERQVNRIVKEAGEATGILAKYEALGQTLSPHSFRHAYATHCYESGMDLFILKQLLGHTYLETTRIYVNLSRERCHQIYAAAHELTRQKVGPNRDEWHRVNEQETPETIYELLRQAIDQKKQVLADYDEKPRELCPHVLGTKNGARHCFFWQFAGESDHPLPGWRCMEVAKLHNVRLREGEWHGPHEDRQKCIDHVEVVVAGFKLL